MIVLKDAKIFDGMHFLEHPADVLVEKGVVTRVSPGISAPAEARVLDLQGCVVAPGFIDLHGHFRDPGQTWREDLVSGARAAAAGGFAVAVAMPNTEPPLDSEALVRDVRERGKRTGGALILPAGCVSRGRKGEDMAELASMAEAGAVLFTDDGAPVLRSSLLRNALLYASDLGVRLMEHPEDPDLCRGAQVHDGRCSAKSGMRGMPAAGEVIGVCRALALSRETSCPVHLTHVSTAQALEEIRRAKDGGLAVTCDVTPHHLVFSEEDVLASHLNASFKVNPPLRSREDVEALWRGIADGTVDAIGTDHAPWHEDEKDVPFLEASFGIASYECAVAAVLDEGRRRGVPLETLLRLWTSGPAALLPSWAGVPGKLEEGVPAFLTVLDPTRSLVVDPERWRSKVRITPYRGKSFTGAPVATVVAGTLVYDALSETPRV